MLIKRNFLLTIEIFWFFNHLVKFYNAHLTGNHFLIRIRSITRCHICEQLL